MHLIPGDFEMAAVFKSKRACIMAFKILVVIIVFNFNVQEVGLFAKEKFVFIL